jgi:5-methylthioadenosine/S-adenosylhomocysteine deaminase
MTEHCDLLVKGGWLVDAIDGIREDAAIAVQGRRIAETGHSAELASKYQPQQTLDARDRIVIPGLINAHTHASATLFRGYAPDVAGRSFFERMWRIESLLTDEDVHVGAQAGCIEMILSGVTGFANHFSHMDQVATAVEQTGLRAGLSRTMLDRGDQSAAGQEVSEGIAFAERWAGRCSRIQPMLGPHAAYTCSDQLLKQAGERARQMGLTLHLHLAESAYEQELMLKRSGRTTVPHLKSLGLFDNNRVLGAHALCLDDGDLKILSGCDFHAAVCATGKMNRGQGIADLLRLRDAGINVCLGTDGSASDNLDLLMGMKVTHIAQNYLHRQVCAMPPESILQMATINGARALGWETGRLAPGQMADFVLIDANRIHLRPLITKPRSNIVFNLVYYAMGSDVDTSVIDGKVVMERRKILTVDEQEVRDELQRRAQSLWHRAG